MLSRNVVTTIVDLQREAMEIDQVIAAFLKEGAPCGKLPRKISNPRDWRPTTALERISASGPVRAGRGPVAFYPSESNQRQSVEHSQMSVGPSHANPLAHRRARIRDSQDEGPEQPTLSKTRDGRVLEILLEVRM